MLFTSAQNSKAANFIHELSTLHFEATFNPYSEICPLHDLPNAPHIRRCNLALVLDAAIAKGVDSMWIARDLGFRGGRRTGLALTDDIHLADHAKLFNIPLLSSATKEPVMAERTATVIWNALKIINKPIFLWNIFPLHPYQLGNPMSNRCHTRLEKNTCLPLLLWIIETLQPNRVIAIGKDAYSALNILSVKSVPVRHPSYGGQSLFYKGVAEEYGVCW
ncbi:MAG: uracil-DNA glycosylase [Anaerolineae bacterium]|nr:uracil-DNA glycosylase [Gloeobacterales cyanobacterium ES-bin-313]